jgi:hypothetical protein
MKINQVIVVTLMLVYINNKSTMTAQSQGDIIGEAYNSDDH